MVHLMSPTATAILLVLALIIDYMSVGPNSLRDRLAFLMGVAAIREGFNGSPLDRWTVGTACNAALWPAVDCSTRQLHAGGSTLTALMAAISNAAVRNPATMIIRMADSGGHFRSHSSFPFCTWCRSRSRLPATPLIWGQRGLKGQEVTRL